MRRMYYNVIRSASYAWFTWNAPEFDSAWHLDLWAFGLKRLDKIMLDGYGVVTKTQRRQMLTIIGLLERMGSDNDYTDYEYEQHTIKYSEYNEPGPLGFLNRSERMPEEVKKIYIKEFKKIMEKEEKMWNNDADLFGKLFKKHIRKMWD